MQNHKQDRRTIERQSWDRVKVEMKTIIYVCLFFYSTMMFGMPVLIAVNPASNWVSRTVFHFSGWMSLIMSFMVPFYLWQEDVSMMPTLLVYQGILVFQCLWVGAQAAINILLLTVQGDEKQAGPYTRELPSGISGFSLADANLLRIRNQSEYNWSRGLQFFSAIFSTLLFSICFLLAIYRMIAWAVSRCRLKKARANPSYKRIKQLLHDHCVQLNNEQSTYSLNYRWGYRYIRYLRKGDRSTPLRDAVVQVRTELQSRAKFLESCQVNPRLVLGSDDFVMFMLGALSVFYCSNITRLLKLPAPVTATSGATSPRGTNPRVRLPVPPALPPIVAMRIPSQSARDIRPVTPAQIQPVVQVPSRRTSVENLLPREPANPGANQPAAQNPAPEILPPIPQENTTAPAPVGVVAGSPAARGAVVPVRPAVAARPNPAPAAAAPPVAVPVRPKPPNPATLVCQICGILEGVTIELPCKHKYHLECLRSRMYFGATSCGAGACLSARKDFLKMIIASDPQKADKV